MLACLVVVPVRLVRVACSTDHTTAHTKQTPTHPRHPQIDVHVVHAEGQPTVAALVYNESFSGQRADVPKPPVYLYGRESCVSLSRVLEDSSTDVAL